MSEQDWLSLREASRRLGIHPTTLRRWADSGEIPVLLTPGHHRRFSIEDIQRFAEHRRQVKVITGLEQMWSDQALAQTRIRLDESRQNQWLAAFDQGEREHKRELGRRMLQVLLKYLSLSEGGEDLLEEARLIGREHAENTLGLRLPLAKAMEVLFFFRDTMLEAALRLPEAAHVRPEANADMVRRINKVLNEVQLSLADTYDRATPR
ncbi:MAG: helix-turn-helix domain-containing protein [Anaerolineales bacterium]|nr:helix-turn-helix domain-containing protein [Anaerolineales bacterium]